MRNKKNLLLISTPRIEPRYIFPRGIVEIASFLESKGCPTAVLPLSYYAHSQSSKQELYTILKAAIKETEPIVVGISNQSTREYPLCLKIAQIIKEININIVTVIGGNHVTFQDTACIKSPFIDVVVRGEGEWTMLDLLSAINNKKRLENIKGITYKNKRKIYRNPDRPLGDLHELPPINFKLLPDEFVRQVPIYGMLNRGCIYNCSFCEEKIFWKKKRAFPAQRIIDEMSTLELNYNNIHVGIEDSMQYIGSTQFLKLCSQLKKKRFNLRHGFFINLRADFISPECTSALREVGINYIWMGIETASSKVLEMMNKGITFDKSVEACRILRKAGIGIKAEWMIGHPGDNPNEAGYSLDKFKFLFKNDLITAADVGMFQPFPGTRFFYQPQKYGIKILSYDWSKWGEFQQKPICQLEDFSAQQIVSFRDKTKQVVDSHILLNKKVA